MGIDNVHLLRHAESTYNTGEEDVKDCGLTRRGTEQAKLLKGDFDIVVCSPMHRARATLRLSMITYRELVICNDAREHKTANCDFLLGEDVIFETEKEVAARGEKVKQLLLNLSADGSKVLLVAHCDLIWYMTSSVVNNERFGTHLKNAELIKYDFKSCSL
eukprot:Trichotokara_eunicae@DN2886_c0_g1_i1.p1